MFDPVQKTGPHPHPRIFGVPPGVDFAKDLVAGLKQRTLGDPVQLARVQVFLNTSRMRRRVTQVFQNGPATLLPKMTLVTELEAGHHIKGAAAEDLGRVMEFARLVGRLLDIDPSLAPRHALLDLATSLTALMDECVEEKVPLDFAQTLDIPDASGHWQRAVRFLHIATHYAQAQATQSTTEHLRMAVDQTLAGWTATAPRSPILVAGSTGSRGITLGFDEGGGVFAAGGIDPAVL